MNHICQSLGTMYLHKATYNNSSSAKHFLFTKKYLTQRVREVGIDNSATRLDILYKCTAMTDICVLPSYQMS